MNGACACESGADGQMACDAFDWRTLYDDDAADWDVLKTTASASRHTAGSSRLQSE